MAEERSDNDPDFVSWENLTSIGIMAGDLQTDFERRSTVQTGHRQLSRLPYI